MKKLALSLLFLATLPLFGASAEPIYKHPRVAELEDRISKDASAYLRGRFPDRPFLVTVSIDPLRRQDRASHDLDGAGRERLPYSEMGGEEIRDEWDDPQVSLNELMARIRKIQVSVTLPDSVLDGEVAEIKASLYASLHLLNARDEIAFERKPWKDNSGWPMWANFAIAALLFFLIGTYSISRSAIKTLSVALKDRGSSPVHVSAVGGGGGGPAPSRGPDRSSDKPQDVQLSDPTKIRELAAQLIGSITSHAGFPSHHDMFELDELGRKSPAALGAVLGMFPKSFQKKLFSLSYHPCWLEAMHQPGTPSFESLEVLHRMMGHPRETESSDWEQLIILVWRLDEQRAEFVRQLNRDEALAMLAALPKSFSVATARKAFPGAWGDVLDPRREHKPLGKDKIAEFRAMALSMCPLNDFTVIERYKNELDLLGYVRTVDIEEEREIYLVSPPEAMIHRMRAPFFRIFEANDETLKDFCQKFSPQQWALALLNSNRSYLRRIDQFFSEKQKYLFIEHLKTFDSAHPGRDQVAEAREYIARAFAERAVPRESVEASDAA